MPMTVNGFGTSVCGGRGNVGWGSFDAMEWLVAAYLPVIPVKAVHTFDWQGEQYRMIPIRWSFDLVLRTFFSRWAWGLGDHRPHRPHRRLRREFGRPVRHRRGARRRWPP